MGDIKVILVLYCETKGVRGHEANFGTVVRLRGLGNIKVILVRCSEVKRIRWTRSSFWYSVVRLREF